MEANDASGVIKRFRCGLVVGKFAPLHHGHQLVIDAATSQCDQLAIISYSNPEYEGCAPSRREAWLAALYPTTRRLVVTDALLASRRSTHAEFVRVPPNDADDLTHRRFCAFLCNEHLAVAPDAVFSSEAYGPGFALELGRLLRPSDDASRRSGLERPAVTHVLVDHARCAAPISGTLIRGDVHRHRRWLAPPVYDSFVRRVCLVGGESSGKSTLAAALAERLGTTWVPEYGRELWEQRGGKLEYSDMLPIAREQVAREVRSAHSSNGVLVCDTSPLTTLFYSHAMFGRAEAELVDLAARPYDLHVLCARDFPFVQDGTRVGSGFSVGQHDWYVAELDRRGLQVVHAVGSVAERVDVVTAAIERLVGR